MPPKISPNTSSRIWVIINSALYGGITNSAGEWGHTVLVLDGRQCRCGNQGCVEAHIGAPGIIRTLRELDPSSALLLPDDQTATVSALVQAAAQGDATALEVLRRTAGYLGAGIANLVNMFNPELIVIGGWVGMLIGPHLLPELRRQMASHALHQPLEAVSIELCWLRHNPVSMGAATFALEGYLASTKRKRLHA